ALRALRDLLRQSAAEFQCRLGAFRRNPLEPTALRRAAIVETRRRLAHPAFPPRRNLIQIKILNELGQRRQRNFAPADAAFPARAADSSMERWSSSSSDGVDSATRNIW